MQLTYSDQLDLYQELINDTEAGSRNAGKIFINLMYNQILNGGKWIFLEDEEDISLVANTSIYTFSNRMKKVMKNPYATINNIKHFPTLINSRIKFDKLTSNNNTNNYPFNYFLTENKIKVYPAPSQSGVILTVPFQKYVPKLEINDYITGTVTTLTNGSDQVITTGATLTQLMVGRSIFFSQNQGGDGFAYKIEAITTNTITLTEPYTGPSVTTGTIPVKIGQVCLLPEGYQELPVYGAILMQNFQKEPNKYNMIKDMWTELMKQLRSDYSSKTTSLEVPDNNNFSSANPMLFPQNLQDNP